MSITIAVAETVPQEVFARVESLARLLQTADLTFHDLPIAVKRGPSTSVAVAVTDDDDKMREKLLQLLVEDAIKGESDSMLGSLC